MPTHSGRIAPWTTVPVRRSIGPGIPTPAPMMELLWMPASSRSLVSRSDAAWMPSLALCPSGSGMARSATTRFPRLASTTRTWLRPKSMPTAMAPFPFSLTESARRPELVVGEVEMRPLSAMLLTMLDTVAVDRPV